MAVNFIKPAQLPYPSTCFSCGSSSRPCVDWGATREWHGAVLICDICFAHYGEQFNITVPVEKHNQTLDDLAQARSRELFVEQELEGVKRDVSAALDSFIGRVDSAASTSAAEPSVLADAEESDDDDNFPAWDLGEAEQSSSV